MSVFQSKEYSLVTKILATIISSVLICLLLFYFWDKAGDAREVEIRAEYEALAIKDRETKLAAKVAGKEFLDIKTQETEIKYVDRVKEVTKYIKATTPTTETFSRCILTPDFIRVYNDESSSSQ